MNNTEGNLSVAPTLPPLEWENRLVAHYLRSDGPYGGAPLSWLDATPGEIAAAANLANLPDQIVQKSFLKQFSASSVADFFGGYALVNTQHKEVPGSFRYLVLSCFVSAADQGVGNNDNFRDRLAALLEYPNSFQSVSGVNSLWIETKKWVDEKIYAGEPFRELILPNPGSATLIGIATKMAFPSRGDKAAMRRIVRKLGVLKSIGYSDVIRAMDRLANPWDMTSALNEAYTDFRRKHDQGIRLLSQHRFWRLFLSSALTSPNLSKISSLSEWRLLFWFAGYDGASVEVSFVADVSTGTGTDTQSFADFINKPPRNVAQPALQSLSQGILVLSEGIDGQFEFCQSLPTLDEAVVLLLKTERAPSDLLPYCSNIGEGWVASQRIEWGAVEPSIRDMWGKKTSPEKTHPDFCLQGGIKIERSFWLGRSKTLPAIRTIKSASLKICAAGPTQGDLRLVPKEDYWVLETEGKVSGIWKITLRDGSEKIMHVARFSADTPELTEWAQMPEHWITIDEIVPESYRESVLGQSIDHLLTDTQLEISDMLEALYCFLRTPRSEAEVYSLLENYVENGHRVWDILRSLQEARWIAPVQNLNWRARKWRLVKPTLFEISPGLILVEGAIASSAFERMNACASRVGAKLMLEQPSKFKAPVICIKSNKLEEISKILGWEAKRGLLPSFAQAPHCWPQEDKTLIGRECTGVWSFAKGMFFNSAPKIQDTHSDVQLSRWYKRNDRDVFMVEGAGTQYISSARSSAICEAYRRRGEALFEYDQKFITRRGSGGHIPDKLARALRINSLKSSGLSDDELTYQYPALQADVEILSRLLGPLIAGFSPQDSAESPMHLGLGRRFKVRQSVWKAESYALKKGLR